MVNHPNRTKHITVAKLRKFVKTRNRSSHQTNLQFQIDANSCGFSVDDLGQVRKFMIDGFAGYEWQPTLPGGASARVIEFGRSIYLEGETDEHTKGMFALMPKAVYEAAA